MFLQAKYQDHIHMKNFFKLAKSFLMAVGIMLALMTFLVLAYTFQFVVVPLIIFALIWLIVYNTLYAK
jgi:hypothetical protein